MFSAIYETDSSSAVSHSAFGRFLPGSGRQLVTVCLKTLRIYRFNPHARYIDSEDHNWKDGLKLECIYSVDLLTPVKSLGVARIPSNPDVDSLVLAFDQAKVSTIYFDSAKFAFETTSLHDFNDESLKCGFKTEQTAPKVCIDPQQRCAAILLFGRHLAILPFNDNQTIQSYTISLKKIDSKLDNIVDISFLHGYYEPTLLIVYEPIQTTTGRASIRYDTVNLLAVSLNVKDQVHAVIWNVGGLPTTIHSCLSFPTPVGGACLFGSNEVIYLNQAVPPCGLALNSDVDEFTRFPFATETKTLRLTLDGCIVELLTENEVLIATRNGELYLLSLNVDISNAVKQMRIQKIFDATTPFTLTSCYPGYIFLGSKLADSLLLHYERQTIQLENGSQNEKNQSEEQDVQMDEDDLYLYSAEPKVDKKAPVVQQSVMLKFSIADRFLNTAPCKVLRVANANDVQAEFSNDNKDVFFDLVSASGNGRESSMCFFQRTVRPFVQPCIEADGALELFKIDKRQEGLQKYLVAAMDMSTGIYELKNNTIDPLDSLIFATQETTILIGELKKGEVIVQVTPMNIVLIGPNANKFDEKLKTINLNTNFPVTAASIVDPYIALLTQNGRLLLYKAEYGSEMNLVQISTEGLAGNSGEKSSITTISIYKDLSGLTQICDSDKIVINGSNEEIKPQIKTEPGQKVEAEFDDIDALLYGNDEKPKQSVPSPTAEEEMEITFDDKPEEVSDSIGSDVLNPTEIVPSYFILIVRENGSFYIHNLNDLQLVYRVKKLNDLSEMLIHTPIIPGEFDNTGSEAISTQQQEFSTKFGNIGLKAEDTIMEIRINGLGLNNARPVLSVMIDDVIWFYEMFVHNDGIKGSLMVRFRRLNLSVITRSTRFMGLHGKFPVEATRDVRRRSFIIPYDRIGDLSNGLFIAGHYPSFLVSAHGEFFLHPFIIDGPIISCYEINRSDCPNGFIYLKANDFSVRTAYLNPEIRYDHSYPVRRICFDETVRFVVFLLRWNLFALITCRPVSHNKLCVVTNEDKQMETHERDENYVLPEMDQFKLQLFSTFDWNFIPNSAIEFDEFETITCCEEVLLNSESTLWGLQSYLAVGTALNYGEEVFVRGRILIYEVIDVVPEEGLPTTRNKLKCVYDKEQKGPVTSMCHCNGFLLTGMGQKIFIWQFRDGLLNGVSFLDTHFYVHNLVGFRSLALACDMFRSVSLIRYQEDHKVLSLVSKDLRPFTPSPMSSQFLLDRNHLFFVLSDENGNVSIFSYLPEVAESYGGENLVLLGSLNIGSPSNGIVRVNGHAKGPFLDAIDTIQETQTNIICTLDGSWSVLRPINERAFRRLQILQQLMVSHVPQSAGLNPRACRAAKPQKLMQQSKSSNKAIVDGNFVFQFMNLSSSTKSDLARASGSNRYQIMDDITEFRRACTHL